MLLYKAVESLNLNESDGTVDNGIMNKHFDLGRVYKTISEITEVKGESQNYVNGDSKKHIIRAVVGIMVTFWFCEV